MRPAFEQLETRELLTTVPFGSNPRNFEVFDNQIYFVADTKRGIGLIGQRRHGGGYKPSRPR